jgi:pyruvate-formate lyase-activating enzyme
MEPSSSGLHCNWLSNAVTVLCDGTVTCGLDDPFKVRNHGNLGSSTLRDILAGHAIAERRRALEAGIPCHGCAMYERADGKDKVATSPSNSYPGRLIVEPSIKCNIRCNNETCNIANDKKMHLRRDSFMDFDMFTRLIDEVGIFLNEIYFYNYGEPFLHPRALDMLAYAKKANPSVHITTSTNGILLTRDDRAERIAAEGLVDYITFTIGGVDQDSYSRYHKAASFEKAMLGMRRLLDEKRRIGAGRPIVHWRYLLFHWNDSDAQIAEAQRLSEEIGVDEFRYMLTASPMGGRSLRRAPGTPGFDAIKPWLAYQEGFSADAFGEAGLWGAEHCERNGPFSWTGARVRVLATPEHGRIRLRLARGGTDAGELPAVRVHLPWGESDCRVGRETWEETEIMVPAQYGPAPVGIELEIEKLFAPMRHNAAWGDNRELGVMLSLNNITPAPNPFRAGI